MKNRGSYPALSEKLLQVAASRELTDSDLNQVSGGANGGSNPDADTWKTCDHFWATDPGCPRTPDYTYCMKCGRSM